MPLFINGKKAEINTDGISVHAMKSIIETVHNRPAPGVLMITYVKYSGQRESIVTTDPFDIIKVSPEFITYVEFPE